MSGLLLESLLAQQRPEWPDDLLPAIRAEGAGARLIVLDDDPTGAQTTYGVPVLTQWDQATLAKALARPYPAAYILTNTRAMPVAEAVQTTVEVAGAVQAAVASAGLSVRIVCRSDSTLRGHYPAESDALAEMLGGQAVTMLVPAFFEGGRYTVSGVQYVLDEGRLVEAAQTEFARDPVFHYESSYLPGYVAERTGGRIRADQVTLIELDEIRVGGPDAVAARLLATAPGAVVAPDALTYRDLEVVALGMLRAERAGARFVCRAAASFVRALAGLAGRPLLRPDELAAPSPHGGLVVVGSYVERSTAQLAHLLSLPEIVPVELSVGRVLAGDMAEVERVAEAVNQALGAGLDAVLFTTRGLVRGASPAESLQIGRRLSSALTQAVSRLRVRPRFLIAKGGVTSQDIAVRALGVRMAMAMGQALPGVPVWELGPETAFAGISYVIFPGNVGGPGALADLVRALRR